MVVAINVVQDSRGCQRNVFFKSWDEKDANRKLVDVIVNSFSAPLYFGSTCRPEEGRVYLDGGVGVENIAIDETMTEANVLGWSSPDNHLTLNAIGCLYSIDSKKQQFNNMCKENTFGQLMDYLSLGEGGIAGAMSLSDQVEKAAHIAKHNQNISFRYWDHEIDKKANGMDKLEYLNLYRLIGVEMCKTPLLSVN